MLCSTSPGREDESADHKKRVTPLPKEIHTEGALFLSSVCVSFLLGLQSVLKIFYKCQNLWQNVTNVL